MLSNEVNETVNLLKCDLEELKTTTNPDPVIGRIRGDLVQLDEQLRRSGIKDGISGTSR